MTDIKYMSVKEFRELGYLQELNRLLLHPLGLALEVVLQENGQEYFGKVWDNRDDPEGMIYGEGMIDPAKVKHVYDQMAERQITRLAKLGYVIQPEEP